METTHDTVGFVGLGRMGGNMAARLVAQGIRVVGMDPAAAAREAAVAAGVHVVDSYTALTAALTAPRVVWLMVPSAAVDGVVGELLPHLTSGDVLIDGGNSFYEDSLRRHDTCRTAGVHFLDCGVSGGVAGARHGASLMVGGVAEIFIAHEALFAALAAPRAYARVGGPGAGHFAKMVHNGIEYGMMGAIAEGMATLQHAPAQLSLDTRAVLTPYAHESVIAGKLMQWLYDAYAHDQLETLHGTVPVGETEQEMTHLARTYDMPVLDAALRARRETREHPTFAGKVVAALRNRFGGHRTHEKE